VGSICQSFMVETTGVNRTLCAPRRPAFHDVSLHVSPIPGCLTAVETTQPPPASLWCAVYVWALRGGLHLSTACGAKLLVLTAPCVCIDAPPSQCFASGLATSQASRNTRKHPVQPPPNSDYFANLPTAEKPWLLSKPPHRRTSGPRWSRTRPRRPGFLVVGRITHILHESGDGVFKGTEGGGGDAWGLSLPRCWPASQEADAKSARMPRKRKADDEGF
jgi:hypothetical protein